MNNVLLTSAGRRVELASAFKAEMASRNPGALLYAVEARPDLSAVCQIVDRSLQAPRVTDPSYVDFLWSTCRSLGVGLVIPTIDTELFLLAQHRRAFAEEGIHLVVSDEDLVRICRDKRLTGRLFADMSIDTPRIYPRSEVQFPCFVKPYDGSSSIGAAFVASSAMMTSSMLSDEKLVFMEWIDGSHKEFTVDAYFDRSGQLQCCVPRERIEVRAGEVSKGVTRRSEVYDYLMPRLKMLHGARGCITFQLFYSPATGRYAALEINPRFGGGFPLAYSAGANFPGWLIDEYLLDKPIAFLDSWEANLMMLRYDAKVLVHGFS
jgi:carbamoyl-phosphate synthase large subunit